jgi:sulfoxide reductase heme-binding subunit YedZ
MNAGQRMRIYPEVEGRRQYAGLGEQHTRAPLLNGEIAMCGGAIRGACDHSGRPDRNVAGRLLELTSKLLTKVLAQKLFALAMVVGVGIWFLVIPAISGGLGANPPEKLLHRTGEIAIWTLGAVLSLSPLRVLFPRSRLVNALNRHRRVIGVSACVYGLMHFGFHLLYEGDGQAILRSFSKPFIWFGLAGLSILVTLAATSNNFSIRKLGGKNWKRLHRLAYAAAAILIYHQAIAGKGHWHIARWLLFFLLALQIARLLVPFLRKRNTAVVAGGVDPIPTKTGNQIGLQTTSSRVGGTTTTGDRTI